ncbi:Late embryogenesis abundant protein Lea5 [Melia azedarach]|uniref:Late embryogenesis abundant protein Lea5 n=1 Tax=Melia azedarach TaxID=155640 RepID=A0ACC1YED8_MELAZ|nr:Late embryogenesis abundant protein Lea5 [Melia azedarach]
MARSLSNAKLLVASVADGLSISLGRGYAAAAEASFARGGSRTGIMEKTEIRAAAMKEEAGASSSAWALDPIKGYYKPQNCAVEIDPAELRQMLLNHKVRPHSDRFK